MGTAERLRSEPLPDPRWQLPPLAAVSSNKPRQGRTRIRWSRLAAAIAAALKEWRAAGRSRPEALGLVGKPSEPQRL